MSNYGQYWDDSLYEDYGDPDSQLNYDDIIDNWVKFSIQDIADQATLDISRGFSELMLAVANALQAGDTRRKTQLQAMFKRLAQLGRTAMLVQYDRFYGRSRSYRWADSGKFKRFSNKVLRRTLASSEMFSINEKSLRFGNARLLDRKARQWYRLSFGAGNGRVEIEQQRIQFFGRRIDGPSLRRYVASKAFLMPEGVFSPIRYAKTPVNPRKAQRKGGPGLAFYPTLGSRHSRRFFRTKGIVGSNYLEAGIQAINQAFGPEYEKIVKAWLEDAMKESGNRGPLKFYITVDQAKSLAQNL